MRRVRSWLRLCAWLALFALAFQHVASFEHLHGVKDSEYRSVQLTGTVPTDVNVPSENANDQTPDNDDYCAVCALVHLVGAIVVAEPPTLALSASLGATRFTFVPAEFNTIPAFRAPFSARAPPAT